MADQRNGGIAWTDATWNPLRGCSRVSEGCRNCYAESMAARFCGAGQPYEGTINPETKRWNGNIKLVHDKLTEPLRWHRPRMVFVNSMSDLFHENVPYEFIDQVFAVMALAKQHTFQVLTKRPERMREYANRYMDAATPLSAFAGWASDMANIFGGDDTDSKYEELVDCGWPLPNVWLGVTVENQEAADERIPLLLQTSAAVRWVSVEPMLGAVDLHNWLPDDWSGAARFDAPYGDTPPIDWVVVGGESGTNARPMHPEWARSLRDQCETARVPFLFKQWGEWSPEDAGETPHADTVGILPSGECAYYSQGYVAPFDQADRIIAAGGVRLDGRTLMDRIGKKRAGRMLDGVQHDGYPIGGAA